MAPDTKPTDTELFEITDNKQSKASGCISQSYEDMTALATHDGGGDVYEATQPDDIYANSQLDPNIYDKLEL